MRIHFIRHALPAAAFLLVLLLRGNSTICAANGIGRVIAKLDIASLHLSHSVGNGGGHFAVLDSDVVVLAEGKDLLVFQNNELQRSVHGTRPIYCLSIDRKGDGVIVSDTIVYRVRGMKIEPVGMVVIPFWTFKGGAIDRVYFDDDSTLTLVPNAPSLLIKSNADRLDERRYIVFADGRSAYIANYGYGYIGSYDREEFFRNFSGEDGGVRLWSIAVQDGRLDTARIMDIGHLGDIQSCWGPSPFDKERGLFYIATLQNGCFVVREFDIRDFVPGE